MKKQKIKEKKRAVPFKDEDIALPKTWIFENTADFMKKVEKLNIDEKKAKLDEMRSLRKFYQEILREDYRATNPNSYRYAEAEKILRYLNAHGKTLKEHLESIINI